MGNYRISSLHAWPWRKSFPPDSSAGCERFLTNFAGPSVIGQPLSRTGGLNPCFSGFHHPIGRSFHCRSCSPAPSSKRVYPAERREKFTHSRPVWRSCRMYCLLPPSDHVVAIPASLPLPGGHLAGKKGGMRPSFRLPVEPAAVEIHLLLFLGSEDRLCKPHFPMPPASAVSLIPCQGGGGSIVPI